MQELDLTGAREFVTKETADELLAPLLAPGAKFTKARRCCWLLAGADCCAAAAAGWLLLQRCCIRRMCGAVGA